MGRGLRARLRLRGRVYGIGFRVWGMGFIRSRFHRVWEQGFFPDIFGVLMGCCFRVLGIVAVIAQLMPGWVSGT